ncbi:MAG: hypothetical protein Q4D38_05150 [Planctomycetia bacterium]|nr:hypothetical protein [Planctomycetia bacterium]
MFSRFGFWFLLCCPVFVLAESADGTASTEILKIRSTDIFKCIDFSRIFADVARSVALPLLLMLGVACGILFVQLVSRRIFSPQVVSRAQPFKALDERYIAQMMYKSGLKRDKNGALQFDPFRAMSYSQAVRKYNDLQKMYRGLGNF